MKLVLGMEVGLSSGDCVRWGPSPPLPLKRGGASLPNFRPISIVVKRLDASRYHLVWMLASAQGTVLHGDPVFLPQQRGWSPLPIFGLFLLCPNGWMHQDATRYGGRPQPRRVCVRWGPSPLPKRGDGAASPIFRVEVRSSKLDRKGGALPVVANFVALEQQIILVKTISELV